MPSMLVTCPETAHLERIEFEDHPVGMLVTSCTRFCPPGAVTCEGTCAARLDRKRRKAWACFDEENTQVGDDTLLQIRRCGT